MTTVAARRPSGPVRWNVAAIAHLRAAVLSDALGRLRRTRADTATHREIRAWLLSDAIHPFSFVVCAGSCGCDPQALRDGVLGALAPNDTPSRAGPPRVATPLARRSRPLRADRPVRSARSPETSIARSNP